jgi:deoxyribonuclease-4
MPQWLREQGLAAYEYQCGRGVTVGEVSARKLGEEAAKHGTALSLHAPYFINLSGEGQERREANLRHVTKSVQAASWMGARRVVVHMGTAGTDRQTAMACTLRNIKELLEAAAEIAPEVSLCLETMGKGAHLGTLEEVLAVCQTDTRLVPCIDFGHLYARDRGERYTEPADFAAALDAVEAALGMDRAKAMHIHFSRIACNKGGEWKHLTFADTEFGPPHEPLMALLAERDYAPTVICESRGTQAADARVLRDAYERGLRLC